MFSILYTSLCNGCLQIHWIGFGAIIGTNTCGTRIDGLTLGIGLLLEQAYC